MAFQITLGDIVAVAALAISIYSLKKTGDFNRKQTEFAEANARLNEFLLVKEQDEKLQQVKADISANFASMGKDRQVLKVFNKGKGTAKNVRLEFLEGDELFIESEVNDKFPIPILESFQHVGLTALNEFRSPQRIHIKLIWDDGFGKDNTKVLTPTVS